MDDCIGKATQVDIALFCIDFCINCLQIISGNNNNGQPLFCVLYHSLFVPVFDLGQIKAFDKESYS